MPEFCFSARKKYFPIVNAVETISEGESNDESSNESIEDAQDHKKKKTKEKIGFRDRKVCHRCTVFALLLQQLKNRKTFPVILILNLNIIIKAMQI